MSAPESGVDFGHGREACATRGAQLGAFERALPFALPAVIVGTLLWYGNTVASVVEIWSASDTYAHGFLVVPISVWLIWRDRGRLADVPIRPSLLGVLVGVAAGFAWLLGELASVASVAQFALVGMLVSLVWGCAGSAVARILMFPLGFLFFAVPFGDFLFPTMMDWTTHFLVGALRATGIPVFVEGRNLVIPSGLWSVVEGCSGVRYLTSSVVVGCLYAYLTYRSFLRRLVFTLAAVVLPVVANWVRAYLIVMIGHLSDNRLAHGVDHLIYGWVFFGFVILLLFWLGARWREDNETVLADMPAGPQIPSARPMGEGLAVALVAVVAVLMWRPVLGVLDAHGARGPVQVAAMPASGAWQRAEAGSLPEWAPLYIGMAAELREVWRARDEEVGLYLAYYRDQQPGAELISSANRVFINKRAVWAMTLMDERVVDLGTQPLAVRSIELAGGGGHILVWHWYWVGGRWTTSDYLAKLYLALARLAGRGDDAAVVMVYAPVVEKNAARAQATLERFLRELGPGIDSVLVRTMER